MWISVDFNSEEAIYIQLYNQIIEAIATDRLREGESLPSVRQLAEIAGINMHTVNKTYAILREQGYITLDKRNGAVIALDLNKLEAMDSMAKELRIIIARAKCNNISTREIHEIVDGVISEFDSIE
jgi:DNA-binding transcriptional regulator YhcF (GntR family)